MAGEIDWTRAVGLDRLFVTRYDLTPLSTRILVETTAGEQWFDAGGSTPRSDKSGVPLGSLHSLVLKVVQTKKLGNMAMDKITADGVVIGEFDFSMNVETYALDVQGTPHRIIGFKAKVKC